MCTGVGSHLLSVHLSYVSEGLSCLTDGICQSPGVWEGGREGGVKGAREGGRGGGRKGGREGGEGREGGRRWR